MKLSGMNRTQFDQGIFYIVVIWLLASLPVFSKGFAAGDGWIMALLLLLINAFTVGTFFLACYRLCQHPGISALGTAIYVLSIYRFDRCYIERDIQELVFMAVLPLLFYEICEIQAGKGIVSVLILGICCLGLALTDVGCWEVAFLTLVILAVTAFFLTGNGRALLKTGMVLGTGAVAGVLLCLLRMRDLENISLIQEKGLSISGILVEFWKIKSRIPGMEEEEMYRNPEGIGLLVLAGLACFLVLWFLGHIRLAEENQKMAGAAAITAVFALMLTLKSFPWDRLQFLNGMTYRMVGAIKTPAVFLIPALFGCAMAWCCLLEKYQKKTDHFVYRICVAVAVIAVIVSGIYVMDVNNFTVDYYEMFQMQSGIGLE